MAKKMDLMIKKMDLMTKNMGNMTKWPICRHAWWHKGVKINHRTGTNGLFNQSCGGTPLKATTYVRPAFFESFYSANIIRRIALTFDVLTEPSENYLPNDDLPSVIYHNEQHPATFLHFLFWESQMKSMMILLRKSVRSLNQAALFVSLNRKMDWRQGTRKT